MTPRAVTALVDLTHALRADWQPAGIRAAIRTCDHGDPHAVAQALLRRAANPANRTPQLQAADFDDTPATRRTCARGGCYPHGLCAGCAVERGVLRDPATCEAPPPFVIVRKPYDLASPYGHLVESTS
jgi:hypothetical protein